MRKRGGKNTANSSWVVCKIERKIREEREREERNAVAIVAALRRFNNNNKKKRAES